MVLKPDAKIPKKLLKANSYFLSFTPKAAATSGTVFDARYDSLPAPYSLPVVKPQQPRF